MTSFHSDAKSARTPQHRTIIKTSYINSFNFFETSFPMHSIKFGTHTYPITIIELLLMFSYNATGVSLQVSFSKVM